MPSLIYDKLNLNAVPLTQRACRFSAKQVLFETNFRINCFDPQRIMSPIISV